MSPAWSLLMAGIKLGKLGRALHIPKKKSNITRRQWTHMVLPTEPCLIMGISQVLSDFPRFSYENHYSFRRSTKIATKPGLQLVQPNFASRHIVKVIWAAARAVAVIIEDNAAVDLESKKNHNYIFGMGVAASSTVTNGLIHFSCL